VPAHRRPRTAAAFFLLLVLATLGSAISLLELVTAPVKNALRCSRVVASVLCAMACAGIPFALSFNVWADWFPLQTVPNFA